MPAGKDIPILCRAMGRAAIVDGSTPHPRDAFFVGRAHHLVLDGLQVRHARLVSVRVSLADPVQIRNGVFADNWRGASVASMRLIS